MGNYILSIDIGTSSSRALLFDLEGVPVSIGQAFHTVEMPKPGWQEQNPEQIFSNTLAAIKECLQKSTINPAEIGGIGFSSQMYSIFPIANDGKPLMNSMIWADSRSQQQAENLREQYGHEYIYPLTGCPIDSIYPLSKILWIKENNLDIFEAAYKFISIKEYIFHKFTGEYKVDFSCASASGLFNIESHSWEPKALDILGLSPSRLSETVSATALFALNEDVAEETGLQIGTPIVIGAGDGPLANLGSGCMDLGDINIDLGTSGAARTIVQKPVPDENNRLWCYCLTDDRWAVGGILNNVGNLYKWFLEKVADPESKLEGDGFAILNDYLLKSPPGANGLYFLPFLLQSRSPDWDSSLKGTIYGLGMNHGIQHITRAMVEGVAFNIYTIVKTIHESGFTKGKIVFTGGLSKSDAWGQILADILGESIILPKSNEGSAGGAAVLAMYALGIRDALEGNSTFMSEKVFTPNMENHKFYAKKYKNYRLISETIKGLGKSLERL